MNKSAQGMRCELEEFIAPGEAILRCSTSWYPTRFFDALHGNGSTAFVSVGCSYKTSWLVDKKTTSSPTYHWLTDSPTYRPTLTPSRSHPTHPFETLTCLLAGSLGHSPTSSTKRRLTDCLFGWLFETQKLFICHFLLATQVIWQT